MVLSALINFNLFEQEQASKYLNPLQAEDAEHEAREEELTVRNSDAMAKIEEERYVRGSII